MLTLIDIPTQYVGSRDKATRLKGVVSLMRVKGYFTGGVFRRICGPFGDKNRLPKP